MIRTLFTSQIVRESSLSELIYSFSILTAIGANAYYTTQDYANAVADC